MEALCRQGAHLKGSRNTVAVWKYQQGQEARHEVEDTGDDLYKTVERVTI